ncbi:Fumarylacetoacetate hydrolase domain-containing protein 2 [Globisporangium polare]
MFKKFTVEENVSTSSKVKSSQQRTIRSKILEQYPDIEPYLEALLPKKAPMVVAKCQNHVQIVLHEGEPVFYNQRDGPFMPTLKLLHKIPHIMKQVRADKGAIPFVLSGANVMCPGLTSAGGEMSEELEAGTPVAIMAEGKEHAMAIGVLTLSTEEIRKQNKGIGIEMVHFLGDDLWTCARID